MPDDLPAAPDSTVTDRDAAAFTSPEIVGLGDPSTWSHDALVTEVWRLRNIVGLEEHSYLDLKSALLAARDHAIGLSSQMGEFRAKAAWYDEKPEKERHIKNLERQVRILERHIRNLKERLELTIEWANDVVDHARAVQEWAEEIDAFNRDVVDRYGETLAKASSYDVLTQRSVVRVARRIAQSARGLGSH